MAWFGRAKIDFVHAPAPRPVKEKDGRETDLLKICEKTTPPCELNPFLFNGHLQTMWSAVRPDGPPVYYRRKVFHSNQLSYDGTFAVDFVVDAFEESDPELPPRTVYYKDDEFDTIGSSDSKPMLLVLHGLSGGSYEVYLRHSIAPLIGDGGWAVCVVNSRGCAMSKITSGVLYNARATWDFRQMVEWAREMFPNRPLFGLGFSLGASMLTNYCGEEGSNCVLKAAIAVSTPFNLEVSSKLLQSTLIGKEVYLRVMGSSMKNLVGLHKESLEKHTNVDMATIDTITYLNEFDREIQCPIWGYPTEYAYYRDASSSDAVIAIRIPFMALNATDDPIAVHESLAVEEFRQNPNTVLVTTSKGGHLCWFELGGGRWHPRPICNFLNHMAFNVDLDSLQAAKDSAATAPKHGSSYDPMRRKLAIVPK